MQARLAAVSVDLDEVPEYLGIHGLAPMSGDDGRAHAVYERALGRVEAWAEALRIPITFFAVGKDLARPSNAAALRRLAGRGHAIESHSMSHRYDLSRLPPHVIATEVEEGLRAIERETGARPSGFRAPGYTVSEALFDALDEAGITFDSSVFPSSVYWAAKASVLAWMRLRGRASASILDTPAVLSAPRMPYRPAVPYHQPAHPTAHGRGTAQRNGHASRDRSTTNRDDQAAHDPDSTPRGTSRRGRARRFVELPILVTPVVGFPVIGTSVGRAGDFGARALARVCAGSPFANLELHGMDFVDASDLTGPDGGTHPLARLQPELRAPLPARLDNLSAFVEELRRRGFTFVTLAEAARAFAAT